MLKLRLEIAATVIIMVVLCIAMPYGIGYLIVDGSFLYRFGIGCCIIGGLVTCVMVPSACMLAEKEDKEHRQRVKEIHNEVRKR